MPNIEVTLPSGAKGVVRGLKGRELNLFANRQAARRGRTSMQILQNVWISTLEPGPLYDGDVDWNKAPQCDRFTALFYARIATFGKDYSFPHKCGDCGAKYEQTEDLLLRPIKAMPAESIAPYQNGNKFVTEVMASDGTTFPLVYQLLTAKLENAIDKVQGMSVDERMTASLAQRIVSIGSTEDGASDPGTDKLRIKRFLEDVDAGTLFDLMYDMDESDGGIETIIDVECPSCGEGESLDLPLGETYWKPKKRSSSTRSSRT